MDDDVARAIGWSHDPNSEIGCISEQWTSPDGRRFHSPQYTVDDLLAWLNEKLFHVWIEVYGDPAGLPEAWDVYVNWKRVISYGDERDEHHNACAPTLLGAFERIVRQVAAGEPS